MKISDKKRISNKELEFFLVWKDKEGRTELLDLFSPSLSERSRHWCLRDSIKISDKKVEIKLTWDNYSAEKQDIIAGETLTITKSLSELGLE